MPIKPIFDPEKAGRPMRVAAFMSGSGTNIVKLIEHSKKLTDLEGASPFEVVFIFSDRADGKCAGERIALENGLPYFSYDIRAFHRMRSVRRTATTPEGRNIRKEYDRVAGTLVRAFEVDVIALGGYMSYITLDRCVNVHPADLSICTTDGKRKYVGDDAVRDAILDGEKTLRSSTLWTDQGVDSGPLLMISDAIPVVLSEKLESLAKNENELRRIVDEHQNRLKEAGDWIIFPQTIEMIARGRIALDEANRVYIDGR